MKRRLAWAAALAAAVYAMVYADLLLRARSAYLEGERHMRWHERPAEKRAHLEAELERAKARLRREREAGVLTEEELRQKLELAEFRHQEALEESSLKYAYHWYKTAVDLFSPPQSRWVRLSRQKMAVARRLWEGELKAKKIPYEEYMLE